MAKNTVTAFLPRQAPAIGLQKPQNLPNFHAHTTPVYFTKLICIITYDTARSTAKIKTAGLLRVRPLLKIKRAWFVYNLTHLAVN
jgi:hypothetical protein